MTESERIETLIERLKSRKGSYQWGQKIQQWLHVEERDLIVKALEHYKLSINGLVCTPFDRTGSWLR